MQTYYKNFFEPTDIFLLKIYDTAVGIRELSDPFCSIFIASKILWDGYEYKKWNVVAVHITFLFSPNVCIIQKNIASIFNQIKIKWYECMQI